VAAFDRSSIEAADVPQGCFSLSRAHPNQIRTEERWRIWLQDCPQSTKQPIVPFKWDDRLAHLPDLLAEPGVAMTAKLTLIGRPV
jgi:hypothetical protein